MIPSNIKNIIFDLGGLLIKIDYNKSVEAFRKLGMQNFDVIYSKMQQSTLFDLLETGKISEVDFIHELKQHLPTEITNQQILDAWNSMLLNWSVENLNLIKKLKKNYQLFLFSNTNSIHHAAFLKLLKEEIGDNDLSGYFVKTYYSHEFGMRKPHEDSFKQILDNHQLNSSETLFLDDSEQHIIGARKAGIHAIHVGMNGDLAYLFP
ncbi:MAG: HAD family phosphatase [Crocinitomicaceae bacterium]